MTSIHFYLILLILIYYFLKISTQSNNVYPLAFFFKLERIRGNEDAAFDRSQYLTCHLISVHLV